jgi:hypothetical protein
MPYNTTTNIFSANKGDLIFFKAIDTPMLLISSTDIALDLMEKRSAIYSDRPACVMDEL